MSGTQCDVADATVYGRTVDPGVVWCNHSSPNRRGHSLGFCHGLIQGHLGKKIQSLYRELAYHGQTAKPNAKWTAWGEECGRGGAHANRSAPVVSHQGDPL